MTLTCPKCGQPIGAVNVNVAQDAAFCAACGEMHKLSALTAAAQNAPAAQFPQTPAQPPVPQVPPQYQPQPQVPPQYQQPVQPQPMYQQQVPPQYQQAAPQAAPQYQQPVQPQYPAAEKNLWQHFASAFKKYVVFRGRARRAEYWGFALFMWIFMFIGSSAGARSGRMLYYLVDAIPPINIVYYLVYLVFALPALAVCIRRMHDCDKSGWFVLVPIYNIILLFTKGTQGPNRFGPDPKAEV
jgi:uncharacterized membrane protein YhaH (DUF805 family)